MKNIQYITDNDGNRKSMIVPLEDDEETIENYSSKIFENELIKQLVFSLLDISFEYLKVPVHRSKGKDATSFLKSLADLYIQKRGFIDYFKLTLMDGEIAVNQNYNVRTIRKQRNNILIPAMNNKKIKAVIHRPEYHLPIEQKGSIYELNFLRSVNKAVHDFLSEPTANLQDLPLLSDVAQRTKLNEVESSNSVFKKLIKILKRRLDELPDDFIDNEAPSARKGRDYQNNKHGKI